MKLALINRHHKRKMTEAIKSHIDGLGMSHDDIATQCGVTVHAIVGWLYRGAMPSSKHLEKLDNLKKIDKV